MRLGFIGGFGHHYLRHAISDPSCGIDSPVAIAGDRVDNEAAEALARKIPGAIWFADPESMLEQFRPNAVSVGVRYGFNGDIIARVLERDLPVVSEKPIAATWAQYEKLTELTRDPRRVLLTEFDFRCRPSFVAARLAISQGLIGDVVLVTAQKSYRFGNRPPWYQDRQSYAGTLLWVASHAVDVIPFTTGRHFQRVTGMQGNLTHEELKPQFEDHCVAVFQLDNGATAVVHADYCRPLKAATHGDDRLRVAGSMGVVEVVDGRCWLTTNDSAREDITETGICPPIHVELLAAIDGRSEKYGTASSMEIAAVLLRARDALDESKLLDIR